VSVDWCLHRPTRVSQSAAPSRSPKSGRGDRLILCQSSLRAPLPSGRRIGCLRSARSGRRWSRCGSHALLAAACSAGRPFVEGWPSVGIEGLQRWLLRRSAARTQPVPEGRAAPWPADLPVSGRAGPHPVVTPPPAGRATADSVAAPGASSHTTSSRGGPLARALLAAEEVFHRRDPRGTQGQDPEAGKRAQSRTDGRFDELDGCQRDAAPAERRVGRVRRAETPDVTEVSQPPHRPDCEERGGAADWLAERNETGSLGWLTEC
jgi:hypothetical protein